MQRDMSGNWVCTSIFGRQRRSQGGAWWCGAPPKFSRAPPEVVGGGDAQVMQVNNNLLYTRKSCFSSIQVS